MHNVTHASTLTVLSRHFFRKMLGAENGEEGSRTSVIRALAAIAAPMLMAAFWIATLTHHLKPNAAAGIHYLFVLYSFCAMGCVTTVQWERLFPERTDFLILLPLPLQPITLFLAKLRSVSIFLGLFLVAANVFATLLLPALAEGAFFRAMLAHASAVLLAGLVSSLAVLTVESLVVAATPLRWYRTVALLAQIALLTIFLTLFLRLGTVSERLPLLLSGTVHGAGWFPLLWLMALYEEILHQLPGTPFMSLLAVRCVCSVPVLALCVAVTYPVAWVRRHRMALEGAHRARLRDRRIWSMVVHRVVLRSPDGRAIFHFIRQTIMRLGRYHVVLAVYCASGLALCLAAVLSIEENGGRWSVHMWHTGVQLLLPILLFWTVAGLRVAFLLPTELSARWIFRLAPLRTYDVVSSCKAFVFLVCCVLILGTAAVLASVHWNGAEILLQILFGADYAVLLTDLFFFLEASVPFTRPRLTEQGSLPLTLATFVFGVPVFCILAVTLERWVAHSLIRLLEAVAVTAAVHFGMRALRGLASHPVSNDPFLGETDSDVRTLGLSL